MPRRIMVRSRKALFLPDSTVSTLSLAKSEPHICQGRQNEYRMHHKKSECSMIMRFYAVIASDGIWEFIDYAKAVDLSAKKCQGSLRWHAKNAMRWWIWENPLLKCYSKAGWWKRNWGNHGGANGAVDPSKAPSERCPRGSALPGRLFQARIGDGGSGLPLVRVSVVKEDCSNTKSTSISFAHCQYQVSKAKHLTVWDHCCGFGWCWPWWRWWWFAVIPRSQSMSWLPSCRKARDAL